MVEGARAATLRKNCCCTLTSEFFLQRQRSSDSDAPSTILRPLRELRMVPLPRYRGGG